MAISEKVVLLRSQDEAGNQYLLMPITTMDAVEGLTEELNAIKSGDSSRNYMVTIGTIWIVAGGLYTQTIQVPGIMATDYPTVDLIPSRDDPGLAFDQMLEWDEVHSIKTFDGFIIVYFFSPTDLELTIQLGC